MPKKKLREGFTTGSAAAAAAKAAILYLGGKNNMDRVDIPLPPGGRLTIPVKSVEPHGEGARATVIKDAGDDPDVTNRAKIRSTVILEPEGAPGMISLHGGKGVGRVTRPGLPVAVGEPAINPAPRGQIKEAVKEGLIETGIRGAVSVTIDVVNGEKIAQKTLNPRLGIVGGISILGTRGTVKPFSNQAYRDTITVSMDVAKAEGLDRVALSTGGKSEGFLKTAFPHLPDASFIQVADFFAFSLEEATKRGFENILYACFFGKLVKMAQGHPYTHARKSEIDFSLLSGWCSSLGIDKEKTKAIRLANTAREARDIITEDMRSAQVFEKIVRKALLSARKFAGPSPNILYFLFDFDGNLLASLEDKGVPKGSKLKAHNH